MDSPVIRRREAIHVPIFILGRAAALTLINAAFSLLLDFRGLSNIAFDSHSDSFRVERPLAPNPLYLSLPHSLHPIPHHQSL